MDNSITNCSKEQLEIIPVFVRIKMAWRRTFALLVDYILVSFFCLLPLFFTWCSFFGSIAWVSHIPVQALKYETAALILTTFVCTPVPLIYLRLFFTVWMHGRTPGESLLSITSRRTGFNRYLQECLCGFLQYVSLLISTLTAIIGFITAVVALNFSVSPEITLLAILIMPPLFLLTLTIVNFSFSQFSYRSLFDYPSGLYVTLQKKQITKAIEKLK